MSIEFDFGDFERRIFERMRTGGSKWGVGSKAFYDYVFGPYANDDTITMVRKRGIWEMKKETHHDTKTGRFYVRNVAGDPVHSVDIESTAIKFTYATIVDECGPIPDSIRDGSPAFPFRGRTAMAARKPNCRPCRSAVPRTDRCEHRLASVRRAIRAIVPSSEML